MKGIKFAFVTAIISGFSIFASKIFVSKMDPVVYTTLKNLLVAAAFSLILFKPSFNQKIKTLSTKSWLKLLAIGMVGGSIPFYLFFKGLTLTSAASGAFIHKTLFIWVAILAIIFLKEKLNLKTILAYALILAGSLSLTKLGSLSFGTGEIMILSATIFWAVENIIAKKVLKNIAPEIVSWARMFFGAIILTATVLLNGNFSSLISLNIEQITSVLIGSTFLFFYVFTWYKALKFAPATTVSSILVVSTIITNFLTLIFIENKMPVLDLNTLLIISGVILVALFQKRLSVSG